MGENFDVLTEELKLCRNSECFGKNTEKQYNSNCTTTKNGVTKRNNNCKNTQEDIENITDIEDKSSKGVAAYLECRLYNKKLYTWAGQALLALHPYCELTGQTENGVIASEDSCKSPSIDSVVAKAWFRLSHNIGYNNQCIVISGDSGSGKTFSACVAIKYIAKKQEGINSDTKSVLGQAWSHVPLLTAFGNASTIHNYNSSRFGKLLQMQYVNGRIQGAFIQTFMLEKCRVSGPNRGESNFHIFSQILENIEEETLKKLYLSKDVAYKISPRFKNSNQHILYEETLKSMAMLQITEINDILKVLSIILNLGNIEFLNVHEKLTISSESLCHLENTAKLFQCDPAELTRLLLKRLIAAKLRRVTMCYTSCLNTEECEERRNCLMRFLYEKLFMWLVKKINDQIHRNESSPLLGILDIYGFETFQYNTFEQLCINYANERLQQYFVDNYLMSQLEKLNEESKTFQSIDCTDDYTKRLELLHGNPSIFGILNEECLIKRYNPDIFICTRLSNCLKNYPHFVGKHYNVCTSFSVVHYAGKVEYDCKTMVAKNRDKVPDEMVSFLKDCRLKFVNEVLLNNTKTIDQECEGKTLLAKFKKSLDKLMSTLNRSDVHYIKCLKPNLHQISGYFDETFVISQLKYNGIMDILKLGLQNYPIKMKDVEFTKRFPEFHWDLLKVILSDKIYFGKGATYLSESGLRKLTVLKRLRRRTAAIKMQTAWRNYCKKRNAAATKIQRAYRKYTSIKMQPSVEKIIDVSCKNSEISIPTNCHRKNSVNSPDLLYNYLTTFERTEKFVDSIKTGFVGDSLSLKLEKVLENIDTKPFKRTYFRGVGIVTTFKLLEFPIRFHFKKTCKPFSNLLPKTEVCRGLTDIL